VSAFTSAKIDRILALKPDLAIGFSDMQADIARALILAGVEVWISNHRTVAGILGYVRRLGAMVGAAAEGRAYAQQLQAHVEAVRAEAALLPRRPRVYFEEWDEPSISAIRWVSELVGIAGGDDIFPERAAAPLGRDRIVADRVRDPGARAGHHHRLLVRQEVPLRAGGGAAGVGAAPRRARWRAARDQVAADPAAWPGGADRWAGRAAPRRAALGGPDHP
jgi:hypothetical protein